MSIVGTDGVRCLPYGDRAVLVEVASADGVLPLRDALLALDHPAVSCAVPAARTVLVEYEPALISPSDLADLVRDLADREVAPPPASASTVELPVRYDGVDLAAVALECGMSVDAVIDRHSEAVYRVQFCGFSPGFAYLTGLHPALHLPRLASPRSSVPQGSVAIAGEYAGVYPRSSPGGWRLLGQTSSTLFDLSLAQPALLTPGTIVRFVRTP